MRVLVTGAAGYIGRFTVRELREQGNFAFPTDLKSTHEQDGNFNLLNPSIAEYLLKQYNPDAIIHLAANALVGESVRNPYPFLRDNLEMIHNLIKATVAHPIKRFVLASSAAVYAPSNDPMNESSPKGSPSPYGLSKMHAEQVLQGYSQSLGFELVALRYFNVVGGVHQCHDPETHIIPLMLRADKTGKKLKVFGANWATKDGTAVRDYVHVEDVARANALALTLPSGAYNVGRGSGVSIKTLLEQFRKRGILVPHEFAPARLGDPACLVSDPTKLLRAGWDPQFRSLQMILDEVVSLC